MENICIFKKQTGKYLTPQEPTGKCMENICLQDTNWKIFDTTRDDWKIFGFKTQTGKYFENI